LRFIYQKDTLFRTLRVEPDPRSPYDLAGMKRNQEKIDELLKALKEVDEKLVSLRRCRESFDLIQKISGKDQSDSLKTASESVKEALDSLSEKVFRDESVQGIYEPSDALYVKLYGTWSITMAGSPLTENQLVKLGTYLEVAGEAVTEINRFLEEDWKAYRNVVEAEKLSLFKD